MRKWLPMLIPASAQFVMAAFVLLGAKLGDILGRYRAFAVGLAIYEGRERALAAVKGGLTPDQASAVAADYGEAQLDALRLSLGAVALAAVLSLWFTRRLPAQSLATGAPAAEPAMVA